MSFLGAKTYVVLEKQANIISFERQSSAIVQGADARAGLIAKAVFCLSAVSLKLFTQHANTSID